MISGISVNNNVYSQRSKMQAQNAPAFGTTYIFNPKAMTQRTATYSQENSLLRWVARKMKNFEHTGGVDCFKAGRSHSFEAPNGARMHFSETPHKTTGEKVHEIQYTPPEGKEGCRISFVSNGITFDPKPVESAVSAIKGKIAPEKSAFFANY